MSIESKLNGQERFFGFDTPALKKRWTAQGAITVQRKRPPIEYKSNGTNGVDTRRKSVVPEGAAVHVSTSGKGVFLTTKGLTPRDWSDMETISFWVLRAERDAPPTTVELQIYGTNPQAKFWRKLVIDHHGWKMISVQLRWMRWGNFHVPEWKDISRFGIYFRDAGDVWVDSISLEDASQALGATLVSKDLAEIAFPDRADRVKQIDSKDVVLVTADAELNTDELTNHLSSVAQQVRADFSFLQRNQSSPKLVILPTRADYRQFVLDYAGALNSKSALPKSGGFTIQDVAASFWDPKFGTLRPVYTHEYVHGLLCHILQFQNASDWLHEGAAAYYQLKAHPQTNFSDIVRKGIEDRNFSTPLETLCNGKRIPLNRYWQAVTIIDLLLTDAAYRQRLPDLIAAFRRNGSTDLGPTLMSVFNTTWDQFTTDWRSHCRMRYHIAATER